MRSDKRTTRSFSRRRRKPSKALVLGEIGIRPEVDRVVVIASLIAGLWSRDRVWYGSRQAFLGLAGMFLEKRDFFRQVLDVRTCFDLNNRNCPLRKGGTAIMIFILEDISIRLWVNCLPEMEDRNQVHGNSFVGLITHGA